MQLFLSYASEERALAERVCRVLEAEGHDVFFDRDDLGGGDTFGERIRSAIAQSDVVVYLISRASIAERSYALTELAIAGGLPRRRRPALLPVRMDETPIEAVPATLRAYTILEPQGDAPAEIAAAVDRLRQQYRQRQIRMALTAAVLLLVAGGVAFYPWRTPTPQQPKTVERDPVDAFNDAILARTPPERRVTITGMPGTDGWSGVLILVDRTANELFYRLDGDAAFTNTGSANFINPMTGKPMPNTTIRLPGEFWRRRTVAVKYTDDKGREHGPYDVNFDPRAQFLQFTKQAFANVEWVTFQEQEPGQRVVYFTTLLSFKAALKEIRYSFDSAAVDKTLKFTMREGEGWPPRMDDEQLFVPVPPGARFVTVKIVYSDGTADMKRFDVKS